MRKMLDLRRKWLLVKATARQPKFETFKEYKARFFAQTLPPLPNVPDEEIEKFLVRKPEKPVVLQVRRITLNSTYTRASSDTPS